MTKHTAPPLEVIIPVLEKSGRGENELTAQLYETYCNIAKGIKKILGLTGKDMKTLARVWEVFIAFEEIRMQPIELSESKFSLSIADCPMIHVGKDVSSNVKSKFCDLICTAGSKALMDTVLEKKKGTCTWSKTLIKGMGKCTLKFELVKAR